MKKLVFILFAVLAVACNENTAPKPDKLLDKNEMVDILYDITLLQSIKSYQPATLDSNNVNTHNYIYRKYNIDSLTFAQNHLYYASDIEGYEKIQKKVTDRINKNKEALAPPAKDSLAKKGNPTTPKP
ncbi:DUF4296 domain-containing protein [Flavobacterium sp. Sd200]|uniref:DUF4296 domain-containing protein n=1 Tax=Flavobacterium sp. Sd200 TaxID=2692211 RepID=UPI00136E222D|nr:DUF4296 domain-containing protein [Flavobacterium sp. Sd200]MXN92135.1 DUF4296 domain-containing protein [Flavobacterium sp. Sd200]